MNKPLIKQVRDIIHAAPWEYDQAKYGVDYHWALCKGTLDTLDWECQTPCCLAGHALVLESITEQEKEQLSAPTSIDIEDIAQKRYQFPEGVAARIFDATWPPDFFNNSRGMHDVPTAADTVWLLDEILKGRFDDWEEGKANHKAPGR